MASTGTMGRAGSSSAARVVTVSQVAQPVNAAAMSTSTVSSRR
ncbi:hypothetical protein [Nocardiopsis algeriensis]|uniref:Uncharacterized protein n=1 Tax=Nocardiopsis algeriensis TaxID=1478215 RepID=A0A841IP67_9ACTN|nr:hypothetical protein [Nocardiopsis algeriensis]MBB6120629.1 hypothetical protein [Nocardiopsis algeriensis]